MRWALIFFLPVLACAQSVQGMVLSEAIAAGGGAPPALVTSGHTEGSAGGTISLTTTGANFLVVTVSMFATPTITDSVTSPSCSSPCNTWTPLTSYAGASPGVRIYYAQNPTVGTGHVISVTGGSTFLATWAAAFSGMQTSGVFVGGADVGASFSSATSGPTGNIAPGSGSKLIITGIVTSAPTSMTQPTSFSLVGYTDYSGGVHFSNGMAYLIQNPGSTINPTWTFTGASGDVDAAAFAGQ